MTAVLENAAIVAAFLAFVVMLILIYRYTFRAAMHAHRMGELRLSEQMLERHEAALERFFASDASDEVKCVLLDMADALDQPEVVAEVLKNVARSSASASTEEGGLPDYVEALPPAQREAFLDAVLYAVMGNSLRWPNLTREDRDFLLERFVRSFVVVPRDRVLNAAATASQTAAGRGRAERDLMGSLPSGSFQPA